MRKESRDAAQLSFLSTTARHALRSVLLLARRADRGWVSAQELSAALDAPANYLSKVLRLLVRRGLLESVRGPHGGFRLAVPASEITLESLLEIIDDSPPSTVCLMGGRPCDPSAPCVAHDRWMEVKESVVAPLRATTIADLVAEHANLTAKDVDLAAEHADP